MLAVKRKEGGETNRERSVGDLLGYDRVVQQSVPSFLDLFEGEMTRKFDPCVHCMKVVSLQTNICVVNSPKNIVLNVETKILSTLYYRMFISESNHLFIHYFNQQGFWNV